MTEDRSAKKANTLYDVGVASWQAQIKAHNQETSSSNKKYERCWPLVPVDVDKNNPWYDTDLDTTDSKQCRYKHKNVHS